MKEIQNISEDNGTFVFKTKNIERAVVLREMLFFRVKIFAVHSVIFHRNDSVLHDEHIAMFLGNLVIDNTLLDEDISEYRARIKFTASINNRRVTVSDIFMIDSSKNPFLYQDQLLTELKLGESLFCDIIIRRKMFLEDQHCKWQPCNLVTFKKNEDSEFIFSVETTGALPLKKVAKQALLSLNTLNENPIDQKNSFFRRPENFSN